MTPALRWAAMRAIVIFHQSPINHNRLFFFFSFSFFSFFFFFKRKESRSRVEPRSFCFTDVLSCTPTGVSEINHLTWLGLAYQPNRLTAKPNRLTVSALIACMYWLYHLNPAKSRQKPVFCVRVKHRCH